MSLAIIIASVTTTGCFSSERSGKRICKWRPGSG